MKITGKKGRWTEGQTFIHSALPATVIGPAIIRKQVDNDELFCSLLLKLNKT